jgi:hypothetical protein
MAIFTTLNQSIRARLEDDDIDLEASASDETSDKESDSENESEDSNNSLASDDDDDGVMVRPNNVPEFFSAAVEDIRDNVVTVAL